MQDENYIKTSVLKCFILRNEDKVMFIVYYSDLCAVLRHTK